MDSRKCLVTKLAAAALAVGFGVSAHASVIADFTTDTDALPSGLGTSWSSGGAFNTDVSGGWDAGDYDWQMGFDDNSGAGRTSVKDFDSSVANFTGLAVDGSGIWNASPYNIRYFRDTNPPRLTTSNSALNVIALTMDVLASPQLVTATATFGDAAGGTGHKFAFFLNNTLLDTASGGFINGDNETIVGATADTIVSDSFTLNQGDTLYFVLDPNFDQGADLRPFNFTVDVVPEPGSLALAGLGSLLFLGRRRAN